MTDKYLSGLLVEVCQWHVEITKMWYPMPRGRCAVEERYCGKQRHETKENIGVLHTRDLLPTYLPSVP